VTQFFTNFMSYYFDYFSGSDIGGGVGSSAAPPFPQLTTLCLYGNQLRELPRVLARLKCLPKLTTLDLAGNPCSRELESRSDNEESGVASTRGGGTHTRFALQAATVSTAGKRVESVNIRSHTRARFYIE